MLASIKRRVTVVRTIRRLYREDEEFQLTWDDYLLARKARRHFEGKGNRQRSEEYARLCEELARDVREYVDRQ